MASKQDRAISPVAGEESGRERIAELERMNAHLLEQIAGLESHVEELQCPAEELVRLKRELERIMDQLAAANQTSSHFLGIMSHELRTPLNSVLGFSEILLAERYGPLNEKQKRYVSNIHSSGRDLLALINEVLDIAKLESGKMVLELSRFSLRKVLNSGLAMLREKAFEHGISLTLEVDPKADTEIEADQRRLHQIIVNLLSNAVKFTPDHGSVRLSARLIQETRAEIPVPLPDRNFIEIAVEDTGVGIKEEDLPRLFVPFQQLDSGYNRRYGGTGAGLALIKRLVELHGGAIWAASDFGKGSRFTFVIPVRQ